MPTGSICVDLVVVVGLVWLATALVPALTMNFSQLGWWMGHELELDGTGYPSGLTAEQLDLDTRILAVCDVYDALISKRVYRDAWPHEKAMDPLRREGGRHSTNVALLLSVRSWSARSRSRRALRCVSSP